MVSITDVKGTIHLNPSDKERKRIQAELQAEKKPPILLPKKEIEITRTKPKKLEPIRLEPRKDVIQLGQEKKRFDIAEFRERETVAGRLVKAATSWKTTIVLLATLGTLLAAPAIIGAVGAKAGATTAVAKAGVVGTKITAATASKFPALGLKFAANPKTMALSTKFLVGAGLTLGASSFARDIIGTYPFAAFGKEEAIQGVGFPINKALEAGDIEGAQTVLDKSNELVNAAPTIADKIPYLNVQKAFTQYVEAQATANVEWQRLIDERQREAVGEGIFESPFEKSQREKGERDIATQESIEESRRISEETFQRRQTEIEEGIAARDLAETEKFERIRKENQERARLNTLFYEAIRKRNAGLELTDEEKQILIDRGVSPDPLTSGETTFVRRSRVQF